MENNKFKPGDRIVIVECQETTPEFSAHAFVGKAGVVKDCYRGVYLPPHAAVVLDGEDFFRHCDERWLMLESEYWRVKEILRFCGNAAEWSLLAQVEFKVCVNYELTAQYHNNATRCMAVARNLLKYSDVVV